jgi:hypothetical protein
LRSNRMLACPFPINLLSKSVLVWPSPINLLDSG